MTSYTIYKETGGSDWAAVEIGLSQGVRFAHGASPAEAFARLIGDVELVKIQHNQRMAELYFQAQEVALECGFADLSVALMSLVRRTPPEHETRL